MSTSTSNYGFILPAVNSPTDSDLWGGELNANISEQDALFLTAINWVTSAPTTSFSVTAPTTGSGTTGNAKNAFLCNATSGAIVATLPAATAAGNGFAVAFKKTDSSAQTVTLTAAGSDKIDGAGTFVLSSQYSWAIIICDGSSAWNIFSDTITGYAPLNSPAFTGVPTAPNAGSNTSTTQIATTEFVNPGNLLSANGYQILPSGVIIQWGSVTSSDNSTTSVSFPFNYPNACWAVSGLQSGASFSGAQFLNGWALTGSPTTTGFSLLNHTSGTNTFLWISVGN